MSVVRPIWIIAQQQPECFGHGDYGISWKLPTIDVYDTGDFHPAFSNEQAAKDYIAGLPSYFQLTAVRIQLKE